MYAVRIAVVADAVHDNKDGTFDIEIQVQTQTVEQQRVIAELFPHTEAQVNELLHREALIAAMINARGK